MLDTIFVLLIILWALGFFTFQAGGLIHALLIIALILFIVRMLQTRRVF